MTEPRYTDALLAFMRECREAYGDVCERIAGGRVPAGASAKLTIEIPARVVDQIRFDVLAAAATTEAQ